MLLSIMLADNCTKFCLCCSLKPSAANLYDMCRKFVKIVEIHRLLCNEDKKNLFFSFNVCLEITFYVYSVEMLETA